MAALVSLVLLSADACVAITVVHEPRTASASIPLSDSDWSNMNPSGTPSTYLINMAMVYDSDADRMIVFGGYDGTNGDGSDQTWAYDFESNGWANLAPAIHPNATWLNRAAYDSKVRHTVMFGGWLGTYDNGTYSDETWVYNYGNNTWSNLRPVMHPSARSRQGMAFDAESGRTILFGGHTIDNEYSDETWSYDVPTNTWTDMTSDVRPPGRRSPGMAYDSNADRMILFGGVRGPALDSPYNDTWAYDFETNTWTNLSPPTAPSGRFGFGFAYDSLVDRCILFGGIGGDDTTWAYDYRNNSWSIVGTEHSPPTHAFQGMAYDAGSARTIMFGGDGGSGNDTWALAMMPGPPSSPGSFAVQPGNGSLELSWDPPADDGRSPVTAYRIYRGPSPGSESLFTELGTVGSWTDVNVTNGETYYYQVSAVNANGEGPRTRELSAAPDGTPPETSASLSGTPGGGGWYVGRVYVDLTATDDNSGVRSTAYRIDGGDWQEYRSPVRVAVDGIHTTDFYSTDRAGNVEALRTISFQIDQTPPQTIVALSGTIGDDYWFHSTVTAEITAADAASGVSSVSYRLDGGEWQSYSLPFEVGEGRHVLEAYSVDVAGWISEAVSRSFGVDSEPPYTTAQVSGPAGDGIWYVGLVTVALEATDAVSDTSISYRVDGGAWTTYTEPFVLGDGVHTLEYYAVDASGLQEPAHTQTISIDLAAPVARVSLPLPAASGWYTSPVPVTIIGSDDLSGLASIRYRVDGGDWQPYTGTFLFALEGPHTLEYIAVDAAGNEGPTQSAFLRLDTVAPESHAVLQGTAGTAGWYRSTVLVTIDSSDETSGLASTWYRLDGGAWQPYSAAVSVGEGSHTLEYYATDSASHVESPRSVAVNVDTTPPILRNPLPSGIVTTSAVTISWTGTDVESGIDRYEVRVDAGPFGSIGSDSSARLQLSEGSHTIVVRAFDRAGNEASAAFTITVDTNPLSASGPYGATPLYAIVLSVIAIAVAAALVVNRRRKRQA